MTNTVQHMCTTRTIELKWICKPHENFKLTCSCISWQNVTWDSKINVKSKSDFNPINLKFWIKTMSNLAKDVFAINPCMLESPICCTRCKRSFLQHLLVYSRKCFSTTSNLAIKSTHKNSYQYQNQWLTWNILKLARLWPS